jgi:hypothetical protein
MLIIQIIIIAILAIYAAIKGSSWKNIKWWEKVFVGLAIIGSIIVAYNGICDNRKQMLLEKINAKFGTIHDAQDSQGIIVQIGDHGSKFILADGVFSLEHLRNLFKVTAKDNKLLFSAVVVDSAGKPIAAVDDNEWTRYQDGYEYNNNDSCFEIVTQGLEEYIFT